MAGFKEQIKAKFKAKYPTVTLSNARLDSIVDKLDNKTDSEDTIETALEAINDITPFDEMAKIDDKIRTLEAKKPKAADPVKPVTDPVVEPDPANEPPAWFKAFSEKVEGKLSAIEGEKRITTRKQALTEKLKDAPESYKNTVLKAFNRMQFTTEEEFAEYIAETETDLAVVIQEQSNAGLGKDKPAANFGKTPAEKEVSADMKQYLAENAPKAPATV